MIFSENRLRHPDQVRGKLFRDHASVRRIWSSWWCAGKSRGGTSKFKDRTRFM